MTRGLSIIFKNTIGGEKARELWLRIQRSVLTEFVIAQRVRVRSTVVNTVRMLRRLEFWKSAVDVSTQPANSRSRVFASIA